MTKAKNQVFKTIVVGVDGSDASKEALRKACGLATAFVANLHVINAPKDETAALVMSGLGGYMPLTPTDLFDKRLMEAGKKVIEVAVKDAAAEGVTDVKTHVRIGDPSHEILQLAEDVSADLVVTGRRGLGGMASLFLGSTSQEVSHGAKCAFLTVTFDAGK